MAETLPTIYHALAAVKDGVGAVRKEERNQQQGFNFRGVDSVVNASAPLLNKYGVIVVPTIEDYTYEVVEIGRNKTAMAHMIGKVQFTFYGPQGDHVTAKVVSESMDSGDKAAAKMMSVAYRIALLQVLNLPTDERDPDLDSYERSGAQERHPASGQEAVIRKLPDRPKTAEKPDLAELVKMAHTAPNVESLRGTWTKIGSAGHLPTEIAHPESGEKITFQEFLYEMADKLGSPKSDANGDSGTAGNGAVAPKAANRVGRK